MNYVVIKQKLVCAIFIVILLSGCQSANEQQDEIKIGFIGPLTGDSSHLGQNAKAAAEIAEAEINAAGGINGKKLKIIYEDGGCNEKMAVAAANKLFNMDDVPLIIGSICSRETMSFAPMAEQLQKLVVSYCTSAPALRDAGDFIFRTCPNAVFQGRFAANYLVEKGIETVGVIGCNDHWCSGIADAFEEEFPNVVAREDFEPGATDIRTQLLRIREKNPDAIYFVARSKSTIVGMKQIQELGWDIFLFGADTWDDASVRGKHPNAEYVVIQADLPEKFVSDMALKGKDTTVCTPQAYDTVKIVANLLKQTEDPKVMKDLLYKMPAYPGISGEIAFDSKGDITEASYSVVSV
jgi:branched-chain amino acid transport system substrate-binding protein